MRRRAQAGFVLTAAVGVLAALGGCGTSSHHSTSTSAGSASASSSGSGSVSTTSSPTTPAGPSPLAGGRLTVAPAVGHPGSTVRFTLVAPAASGRHGQTQLSYALAVAGEQGAACVAQHDGAVAVHRGGVPVTVAVGPAQLGGDWCAGAYSARVDELARPVCAPAQVCPQFIRVVGVIGPVRFRIEN